MKLASACLFGLLLGACAPPAATAQPEPHKEAAPATTPEPAAKPAAASDVDRAAPGPAAVARERPPAPNLAMGPDRYQLPSSYYDELSAVLIVDLATGEGTCLDREPTRVNAEERWVTRRGKKKVAVVVERVDLPLPAGVQQTPLGSDKSPGAPKSYEVLVGRGWAERTFTVGGKRYRLDRNSVEELDPASGARRLLDLQGLEVSDMFLSGDELAILGAREGKDSLGFFDVRSGKFTREIPLPPSMDRACARTELRFLDDLVVLPEQNRAYMSILCHHGQD